MTQQVKKTHVEKYVCMNSTLCSWKTGRAHIFELHDSQTHEMTFTCAAVVT